jgi:transcriptional regulator with XRE-family HTH domain
MEDRVLINNIKKIKEEKSYTLHELSNILDVQVSTLERWLKTGRINRMYAKFVREKLGLE